MQQKDNVILQTALLWANESKCSRLKVGAVIAKDTRIISTGYNGTIAGTDNTCEEVVQVECTHCSGLSVPAAHRSREKCHHCVKGKMHTTVTLPSVLHAEQNALMFALRNGTSTVGATMYVTHSPCTDCAKLIAQAGITRVVYLNKYRSDDGVELLKSVGVVVECHQC